MREAIDRDPHNWNFHYGLALARGSAGLDPRPEFRRAHDLNPLDVLTQDALTRFKTDRPGLWKRRATEARARASRASSSPTSAASCTRPRARAGGSCRRSPCPACTGWAALPWLLADPRRGRWAPAGESERATEADGERQRGRRWRASCAAALATPSAWGRLRLRPSAHLETVEVLRAYSGRCARSQSASARPPPACRRLGRSLSCPQLVEAIAKRSICPQIRVSGGKLD